MALAAMHLTENRQRLLDFFFRDADGLNVPNGATRHVGLEIDAVWRMTDAFSLAGAVALARHTYAFDRVVGNGSETIRNGHRVDTAPDTLANIRAAWTPTAMLNAELEWVHVGEYFTNPANTNVYPGHDVFNVRVDADVADAVSVFVAIRNIFDERYATRADFAFGSERYFPGEGRAATVGVRWRG